MDAPTFNGAPGEVYGDDDREDRGRGKYDRSHVCIKCRAHKSIYWHLVAGGAEMCRPCYMQKATKKQDAA